LTLRKSCRKLFKINFEPEISFNIICKEKTRKQMMIKIKTTERSNKN